MISIKVSIAVMTMLALFSLASVSMTNVTAAPLVSGVASTTPVVGHICGGANYNPVTTSIDIGCRGQGNPITDMSFAIIRLLSMGVGLVVVGSIIWAGIQYTNSQGDPQNTAKAKTRIQSAIIALLIYIFAYAILNYVLPAGVFGTK